jgi:hypothetical protein
LPSGENSANKNPYGSDFFCEKHFGKKILLWIPHFFCSIYDMHKLVPNKIIKFGHVLEVFHVSF